MLWGKEKQDHKVYLSPNRNATGARSIEDLDREGNRNSNLTLPNLELELELQPVGSHSHRSRSRSNSRSNLGAKASKSHGKGSTSSLPDIQPGVREFPRIVERRFGESLGIRTQLLKRLSRGGKLGLGPPDLIHITSYDKYHKDIETGQYFYISGVDVSNESMPIAMLKLLKSGSSEQVISTYCSCNIFSHIDIRIRYESDTAYQINAVDITNGTSLVQLSEALWEEAFVSACVRSIISNIESARKLPGLVEYPLLGLTQGSNSDDIMKCKRILELLCRYLPRFLECGWDSTRSVEPTIVSNYLTQSILEFLSIASPLLIEYTIGILKELMEVDNKNSILYEVVLATVLHQSDEMDHDLVLILHKTIDKLNKMISDNTEHDFDNLFLVNCLSELLIIQTQYLIYRAEDLKLAEKVITHSTELTVDSFKSWYWLAKTYIYLGQYDKALLAINSMHPLHSLDPVREALYSDPYMLNYYQKPLDGFKILPGKVNKGLEPCELTSIELNNLNSKWKYQDEFQKFIFGRISMPYSPSEKGFIREIWEDAAYKIGPIFGTQVANLINFVSPQEVEMVADYQLLSRNTINKQNNWFMAQVLDLLIEIITYLGWNGLMETRSKVFVMQQEYLGTISPDSSGNENSQSTIIPLQFRKKRLCERWLDQLFLDIYEDLKITRAAMNNKDVKYSGLEWELLGLTMLRTWQWSDAIACLRTSLVARFDIISATKILELYFDEDKIQRIHSIDMKNDILPYDVAVDLIVKKISYEFRFYNEFQLYNVKILFKLAERYGLDLIRAQVVGLPYINRSILAVMDKMFNWIEKMTTDSPPA
ncbi:ChAPs (Chs5p-Arf1p-binding proteins) [Nakaseomyces glabratus]